MEFRTIMSVAANGIVRPSNAHRARRLGTGLFLGWLTLLSAGAAAFGSTNFTKLIAWGQVSSSTVPGPPGNSLAHINHCYQLGYDGLELDVQITVDNIPILAHDPSLYTFEELQQFNLGDWEGAPVRIPTLEAALRTNGSRGSIVILDMRVASSMAGVISNAVKRADFDERRLAISAYDVDSGQVFKRTFPQARAFLKLYDYPQNISHALVDTVAAAGLDGLMLEEPNDGLPIQDFVDYLHYQGLKLVLFVHYASNTLPELQGLVDTGVDHILTVHHEMRGQVSWPAPSHELPRLEASFDALGKTLTLSWQPRLPYSHRVQTSADGEHWVDIVVAIDAAAAPSYVRCSVPADAAAGFYRLCFVP